WSGGRGVGRVVASACPPAPGGPPRSPPARETRSRAPASLDYAPDRCASPAARDAPPPVRRPSGRDAAASTPRASSPPPASRPVAPRTPRTAHAPAARAAPATVRRAPGERRLERRGLKVSPESRQPCIVGTEVIDCEAKTRGI